MIAVTGVTGKLGRQVIMKLLSFYPAEKIVGLARNPQDAGDLIELGVQIKQADYDKPETVLAALSGIEKLLLISAVIPSERLRQHQAVIDAARQAGVRLIAYTSQLRADTSALSLAKSHRETESYIKQSGIAYTILRNGWYIENHTDNLNKALQHGVILGSSGEGRFSSASREDYAEAAAVVLSEDGHSGKVYELAGSNAYSMPELADELSELCGKKIDYLNLSYYDLKQVLLSVHIPEMIADVVIEADKLSQEGELYSDSNDLSILIGRKTVSVHQAIINEMSKIQAHLTEV
ncbi:SDR family oxidoreductase [Pantoea stewartii]|uniref:SDR family oxidoreductase n=1 Tax=Pantoea stewartii TaxID=66269 RepID=UPI0021E8B80C|nr:SDR family oxidoreductase [Pantoea stewartii]UYK96280.1 SDR family oxidoreductase [Pantoea stewartii]